MAKQIKFFSQTAVPTGTDAEIGGNVYFVNGANNGNEIYKGAVRFGAARVTATANPSGLTTAIRGDINIYNGETKVFNGSTWSTIAPAQGALRTRWISDINNAIDGLIYSAAAASPDGDPIPGYNLVTAIKGTKTDDGLMELSVATTTFKFGDVIPYNVLKSADVAAFADLKKDDKIPTAYVVYNAVNAESTRLTGLIDNKASKGTGKATGAHGVSGSFTLKSNSATHDFTLDVKSAALATNFSTSDYFTTGSIVYGHTVGLVAGDNKKYINKISYDAATGKLTATASDTAHDAASIANANSTSYTLTDVYAVKSYVESKISGLGNVMEFKGVIGSTNTYLSNAKVGDVVLVGADASSKWYWDGSDITSSGTSHVQPGQEFVCVSVNTSSNVRTWELIGDQNAQTTILGNKAQTGSSYAVLYGLSTSVLLASNSGPTLGLQDVGVVKTAEGITANANVFVTASAVANLAGASTSANNGVTVSVSTKGGKIDKVLVTAPAYTAASSTANDADNGVNVAVSTVNGQVKAVDVVVSEAALATNFNTSSYLTTGSTVYAHTSGIAKGTTGSYIESIAYADGKLTATAKALPTVGNGASTSNANGVTISASTKAGVQHSANITITTAALNANLSTSTFLVTGSTMYNHTSGLAQGTTGSYIESISYVDGKLTATATTFPSYDYNPEATTKSGTSNGTTVSVTTKNGAVTAVAVAAPAVAAAATKSSTSKGVEVSVTGHITNVSVVTTLSTTLGADAEHAPTTKAVYEAMCWYSANGSLIP